MTDLPKLTHKQFNFVQGILAGKTASDAYRHAYDCQGMTDKTTHEAASRLQGDSKVKAWVDHHNLQRLNACIATKEAYTAELLKDRQECKESGNFGAAVKALELAGKVNGFYVEKRENVNETRALSDMFSRIETENPLAAAVLRRLSGQEDDCDETMQ